MSLISWVIDSGTAYAAIKTLEKQSPEVLGKEFASVIDKALDMQLGAKKSEQIQKVFVPWGVRFWSAFLKELSGDWDAEKPAKSDKKPGRGNIV
jgi:hypothetical protein